MEVLEAARQGLTAPGAKRRPGRPSRLVPDAQRHLVVKGEAMFAREPCPGPSVSSGCFAGETPASSFEEMPLDLVIRESTCNGVPNRGA